MKSKLNYVIKFLAFMLLFFVLSRAGVNGEIYPFAFAMLFALAWANQKVWLLAPAYLIGCIANNYSFEGIISTVVTVLLLVLPYYVHIAIKKPMFKWELFIFAGLSQVSFVVFSALSGMQIYYIVLSIVVGLVYLYLSVFVFESLLRRGFSYKLTLPEVIAGGIILMSVASGLTSCNFFGFSFLKLFVAFCLLAISQVTSSGRTMIFASLMGLGSLISGNNPIFMAPFIIWALAIIAFKFSNRIFSAMALLLSEVLIIFYFDLYYGFSVASFLPVPIAAVIFLAIPKNFYQSLSLLLSTGSERSGVKCLLNRNRDLMQRRLNRLGEVFYDMNAVFRSLIKKEASEDEIKEMLYEELKSSICKNCPEHKHCHRTFSEDTRKIFINLVSIAFARGKITLLDLPSYLSSRCSQAGRLISEVNTLTSQYKNYSQLVGNIDTSKLLISDQLEGISLLMKSLAGEVDTMISLDGAREQRLIDELSSNNIICSDAVVYERDARTFMATLVVREEDVNKLKLQGITSKICGNKMVISDVYPTEKAGLVAVNLKTAPRFDCIFGLASMTKSGGSVSGDRHSIERLDGDRFIFAICDGMGSGAVAGKKAETAIGLIENFYKAGFESEIILSSVNKLMNLEGNDIFSSMDICIVDLKDGIGDFIKMGAASSYIRGEEGCEIVECNSLPMGILDNAKAVTKKVVLNNQDYIILCSDGINDAFGSDGDFKDFLLSVKGQNPQEYADQILERAVAANSGFAVDDMTVLVVKIF
jgi:stage II sporulation protein E